MKITRILFLSIIVILAFSLPAAADDAFFYSDVTGHWAESDIYYATNSNLINGYPNGTFCPDKTITRAEFVNILSKDAGINQDNYNSGSQYKDVNNHWAKAAINWASQNGIVNGYENGTFKPDAAITREELAVMFNRYLKDKALEYKYAADPFNDQAKISDWALNDVIAMQRYGLMRGDEKYYFNPRSTATRAETATMAARYLRIINNDDTGLSSQADIYVNNSLVKTNAALAENNGITFIGIRDFFEAIGYEVAFYNQTSLVAAYNTQNDLELWLGKTTVYVNGKEKSLSVPAYMSQNTTFLPLDNIGSLLGISVISTDQDGKKIIKITVTPGTVDNNSLSFYGSAASGDKVNGEVSLGASSGFWGTVENGKFSHGSYTSPEGYRYFGSWSASQFSGEGRAINQLGELSIGTFANGYMTQGITFFADGTSFEGEWYYNTSTSAIYPSKGQLTANGRSYGSLNTEWSGGALTSSKW